MKLKINNSKKIHKYVLTTQHILDQRGQEENF